LLCKSNSLQDTRTAIASHHGTRRRRRPQPASRPHASASHSINQIKSNDKPVSTLHAIAHAQHRARVTPRNNQTAHRYLTPSSHHTSQRHCDGRASHNATHSDTMHVQTSARHATTTTQQLQTASECREGHTCRPNTTTLDSRDVEKRRSHPQHTRNAAPPSHCNAAETRVHAAQRDAHTPAINRGNNPTQHCAVAHQPQRDAVHQRTRDHTDP
jgi:hypothetical protein